MKTERIERYLSLGFAVHWLRPKSKKPIAMEWSTRPVATLEELRASHFAGVNLGVRTGHWSRLGDDLGLLVLDVDLREASASDECYGAVSGLLGHCRLDVLSGRGLGGHIYLSCPLDKLPEKAFTIVAQGEGWTLELLGTGKNVVLPVSIHPDTGKPYVWNELPESFPLAPETLLKAKAASMGTPSLARVETSSYPSSVIPEGRRASTLTRWARGYQGGGYSDDEVRKWTHSKNQNACKPPLDEAEVERIIQWALSKPKGRSK